MKLKKLNEKKKKNIDFLHGEIDKKNQLKNNKIKRTEQTRVNLQNSQPES
jgi:hypothetical protein